MGNSAIVVASVPVLFNGHHTLSSCEDKLTPALRACCANHKSVFHQGFFGLQAAKKTVGSAVTIVTTGAGNR